MLSNQRSINTSGGKHWAAALTCRAAAMEAGTYQRRPDQRAVREGSENRSKEERYGVRSTLEIYELRRIFDSFIFLRSSFTKLLAKTFFSFC
jgi:hypothetical protein